MGFLTDFLQSVFDSFIAGLVSLLSGELVDLSDAILGLSGISG